MNGQPLLREVQLVRTQHPELRRTQSMAVGHKNERPIALARDHPEQRTKLRLGEEVNCMGSPGQRPRAYPDAGGKRRASASSGDNSGKR